MEVSQANRYITPTLQANWNLAISNIIGCLNANLIFEAWLACQTLFNILPPRVQKTVKTRHDKIKKEFDSHANNSCAYEEMVTGHNDSITVLTENVRPFFQEMYGLLYEGGYLEKQSGPTTKIGGLDRIEKALG